MRASIQVQNTTIYVYAKNIGPWDLADVQCFWSNVSNLRSIRMSDVATFCSKFLLNM